MFFPDTYQEGLIFGRVNLMGGVVKSLATPDDFTLKMTLARPVNRPYLLGNLANAFNIITTKEVLEKL